MGETADVIIIGAGIAGASLGAELAGDRKVVVLEMEDRPGFHSTGRSAAMFIPTYGPPVILGLTRASAEYFYSLPDGIIEAPVLAPRAVIMLALPGDEKKIEEGTEHGLVPISIAEAKRRLPPLRSERILAAMLDDQSSEMDVDVLHQGYLKRLRRAGGRVVCDAKAETIACKNGVWTVETKQGAFSTPVVVDAAGAWSDDVAARAGVAARGLVPKLRSAALIPVPEELKVMDWALGYGARDGFYFKPTGGKLLLSPADETPVEPHDAWADDMRLAQAVENLQELLDFEVTRLDHTWGGLRTFAADGDPVVGYDEEAEGFFWLAGHGGYGIQTSPALSRTAAALVRKAPVPADVAAFGVTAQALSPARFLPLA